MFKRDRKGNAELRDPLPFPPPAASVSSLIPPHPPTASCSARVRFGLIQTFSYPPPFLLTPWSSPPTPTLLLPRLLVVCMGAVVVWGLIPQACESALSSGLVSRIGSPPPGRSQAALGPARSSLSRRRSSTLGGDGAGNSLGLSWRSWRIQSHGSLSLPRTLEIPGP